MGFTGRASGVSCEPSCYKETSDYLLCSKCSINVIIIISLSLGFQSSSRFLSLGASRASGTRSVLGRSREGCLCQKPSTLSWADLGQGEPVTPLQPREMCGGHAGHRAAWKAFERSAQLGFCPWPEVCGKDAGGHSLTASAEREKGGLPGRRLLTGETASSVQMLALSV